MLVFASGPVNRATDERNGPGSATGVSPARRSDVSEIGRYADQKLGLFVRRDCRISGVRNNRKNLRKMDIFDRPFFRLVSGREQTCGQNLGGYYAECR